MILRRKILKIIHMKGLKSLKQCAITDASREATTRYTSSGVVAQNRLAQGNRNWVSTGDSV